jgi:hypothetical protein
MIYKYARDQKYGWKRKSIKTLAMTSQDCLGNILRKLLIH